MQSLLIANRGEIALRVMRTAQRLGWRTVAIHTDLDAGAPHTRGADRVVRVESYLDVDAVVAAARESGAGYVHPGYGFLSERAPFARALGPIMGPQVARVLREGLRGSVVLAKGLARDGADFLTEESRDLVAKAELEAFYDDVDTLRERVERLAVRVSRLPTDDRA